MLSSELHDAFRTAVQQIMLAGRVPSVATDELPAVTDNYELYLVRGTHIVSSICREKSTDKTLAALIGDEQKTARAEQHLHALGGGTLALALPDRDRVMLVCGVPGLADGEGIAVIPTIGASSMARTLCYSFAGRVELDDQIREMGTAALRQTDEATYLFIERLLGRWHYFTAMGLTRDAGVSIDDRRDLSRHLLNTGRAMFSLLGKSEADMISDAFPVPYPFEGTYHPSHAAWMLLCFYAGLCRSFASSLDAMRVVMDNERLLPMVRLTTSNRKTLPNEWQECSRLAERYGMLFEVKRSKDAVTVCLCPMTPTTSPSAFYALRAPTGVLLQLRASLPYLLESEES